MVEKMRKKRRMLIKMAKMQKKPVKTEFETKVEESTQRIDKLIRDVAENNEDWKIEIADVEGEMESLQKQISPKDPSLALSIVPGEKIRRLLLEWS